MKLLLLTLLFALCGLAVIAQAPFLTFERSECYGTCPAYKVTISRDGALMYEGKSFVKTKGSVRATLTKEQLSKLYAALVRARYFSLRDSYSTVRDGYNSGSDSPWAYLTVRMNGKRKSISHYYGCYPATDDRRLISDLKRLVDLEVEIDRIINIDQWIGTPEWRRKLQYLEIKPGSASVPRTVFFLSPTATDIKA
jgi:hypothetical protein